MQTRKPGNDVDQVVARIDETRVAEHWRNPDRPDATFVKQRRRQDPKIRRAKGRARTAVWRNGLDRLRRPESRDIGMSLVVALVTSEHLLDMTQTEVRFVTAALADLKHRGFARDQTLKVLRRLRTRLVDPEDREGESPGEPIGRSGLMF
jgi:hypothetical protein